MRVEGVEENVVKTDVVSGPRASSVDVGASEVASVFRNAVGVAQGIKKRADEVSAADALTSFEREKNDLFMNPETGYFKKEGQGAYAEAEVARKNLLSLKEKYSSGLSAQARSMFDPAADNHITRGMGDINSHALKGLKAWEEASAKSAIDTAIANAALYWNRGDVPSSIDPSRTVNGLDVLMVQGAQQLRELNAKRGITDPATLANEESAYASQFYAAAVKGALRSSHADAQSLFDKYGDLITGNDRLAVMDAMERRSAVEADASVAAQVTGLAQEIYASTSDMDSGMRAAMSIKDKAISGKVLREVSYLYNLKQAADNFAAADAYEVADEEIRRGALTVDQFIAKHPQTWAAMVPSQKKSIEERADVKTNFIKFHDLMMLPPEALAKVDIKEAHTYLAKPQRLQLTAAVRAANEALGTAPTKPSVRVEPQVGRSVSSQTILAAESIFGRREAWSAATNRKAAQFYDIVDQRARALAGTDRALSSKEYAELLREATSEVKRQGKFFGIPYTSEHTLKEVPEEQLPAIRAFLQKNNKAQSTANIITAWKLGVGDPAEEE